MQIIPQIEIPFVTEDKKNVRKDQWKSIGNHQSQKIDVDLSFEFCRSIDCL